MSLLPGIRRRTGLQAEFLDALFDWSTAGAGHSVGCVKLFRRIAKKICRERGAAWGRGPDDLRRERSAPRHVLEELRLLGRFAGTFFVFHARSVPEIFAESEIYPWHQTALD